MKRLASPSLSSSSSSTTPTTTSIGADMCNSSARTTCFSGLVRRILCFQSLPTYPSDHIAETCLLRFEDLNSSKDTETEAAAATNTRTGIVARLMGLESLPPKHVTTSLLGDQNLVLPRSCSLNSVEFRGAKYEGKHEKVKSLLSFREMQGFLELEEDGEFFVLSFDENDNVGGCDFHEKGSRVRRCKSGRGELVKQRSEANTKEKLIIDKKNDIVLAAFDEEDLLSARISNLGECSDGEKSRTKKNRKKKKKKQQVNYACDVKNEEPDTTSQDSSPVSVLDFGQFKMCPEILRTEEGTSSGEETNPRRKLSLEHNDYNYISQRIDNSLIDDDNQFSMANQEPSCRSWRKKKRACHGEISRLAQAEVVESNWIQEKGCNLRDFVEDISADFELQIFDQFLEELVH